MQIEPKQRALFGLRETKTSILKVYGYACILSQQCDET